MDRELFIKVRVGEKCISSYESFDCFKCVLTLRCPVNWTLLLLTFSQVRNW